MKRFISQILASLIAIILAVALLLIILAALAGSSSKTRIDRGSILHIEINGDIPELTGNTSELSLASEGIGGPGLFETISLIEKAADDDRIKCILLDLSYTGLNQSKTLNLLKALGEFKDSGKPIYAFAEHYGQHAYLLSSVSDSIFLDPNGSLSLKGYSFMSPFYKRLMAKLGVDFKIYYAGKFKGATEPFLREDLSAENELQWRVYLEQLHEILVDNVSKQRNISKDSLDSYINSGRLFEPDYARSTGIVDELWYRHQVHDFLQDFTNSEKLRMINLSTYYKEQSKRDFKKSKSGEKIAVVYAEGEIINSGSTSGIIGLKPFSKILEDIENDDNIKAVVLWIDCPGGDGQVSDALAHKILQLRNSGKKVITSMGSVAASGGYYLAALSDYIVAEENTLTGSIGVFVMFPQVEEFMEEKLEVFFDTIKTAEFAMGISPLYNLSPQQEAQFIQLTNEMYDQFLGVVSKGRNLERAHLDTIAEGRIWTGPDAIEIGLVDSISGLAGAIEWAANAADIANYSVETYPQIKKSFWEETLEELLSGSRNTQSIQKISTSLLKINAEINTLKEIKPLARIPFIEVK